MISEFELMAAKILCKPKKLVNESIIDSIKDRFAQAITDKVVKHAIKVLKNLEQVNPKSSQELLEIIQKRDTDKLRNLFKQYKIPQIVLNGFGKLELRREKFYQSIEAFLAKLRDSVGLLENEIFINALVLFYVIGLCLVVGDIIDKTVKTSAIVKLEEIVVDIMFNSKILTKTLALVNSNL